MWHDNLQAFWDGASLLAIGFDGAAEDDSRAGSSDVGVFASADETGPQMLIGIIEMVAARAPWYLVGLPAGHRYARLRRAGDPEGVNEVGLVLSADPIRGGEWRIAFAHAQLNAKSLFHFTSRPPNATENEVIGWAEGRIEGSMLWGVAQRCLVQRQAYSARIQIGPTRLFWPIKNRIEIDSNVSRPADIDVGNPRQQERAPAIYSKLKIDQPPAIRLRLFLRSAARSGDVFLRRLVLIHVMYQRRHLEDMNALRSENNEAIVEPLTIDRVYQHLPKTYQDAHAAVAIPDSIAAINLATALDNLEQADHAGFELVALPDTDGFIEVNFYGAVLGDDVGIASNAATEGDIVVRGRDPGGYPGARLFRVTEGGLQAYAADESEENTADVMRAASLQEDWSGNAVPPMQELSGHWELFCRRLQLPQTGERVERVLGETLGLFILAAWSTAFAEGPDEDQSTDTDSAFRSFDGFREAPAIISALARRRAQIVDPDILVSTERDRFVRSFAAHIGSSDLVARDLDPLAEFEAWQVLARPGVARQLLNIRVSLSGTAQEIRSRWSLVVKQLHDETRVEEIAQSYKERANEKRPSPEPALTAYLTRRRGGGEWTSLREAEVLARYCKEISDEWERIRQTIKLPGVTPSEARPRDTRDFKTLLASVEKLLDAGRKLEQVQHEVARINGEFQKLRTAGVLDGNILRVFEEKLSELVGSHLDDQVAEEVIVAIEAWAQLPNFLEDVAPRTRRSSGPDTRRKRDLLRDYVNRVYPSVPDPGQGSGFDRLRRELDKRIKTKLIPSGPVGKEREDLAVDLSRYADILLHHTAYCRIRELIGPDGSTGSSPRSISDVKLRLSTWPHRAADTWDRAMSLAEANFHGLPKL
jgi:hypothetical protein